MRLYLLKMQLAVYILKLISEDVIQLEGNTNKIFLAIYL